MKYLIAISLALSILIISRRPKEPTDPSTPKDKKTQSEIIRS